MKNKIKFIIPIVADEDFQSISDDIGAFLEPYLKESTQLEFSCLKYGFPTIETELQGMINGSQVVMQILSEQNKIEQKCCAAFIDCFDDPGVYACREMNYFPVIGPYEAAISTALNLSERVGIITTDEAGILNEEKKARNLGLEKRIVSISPVNLPVAGIMSEKEQLLADLINTCRKMADEDRVTTICLGCTAMFYVYHDLISQLELEGIKINIIEPTLNGILTLENMIAMNYTNYIHGDLDFTDLKWAQPE